MKFLIFFAKKTTDSIEQIKVITRLKTFHTFFCKKKKKLTLYFEKDLSVNQIIAIIAKEC